MFEYPCFGFVDFTLMTRLPSFTAASTMPRAIRSTSKATATVSSNSRPQASGTMARSSRQVTKDRRREGELTQERVATLSKKDGKHYFGFV